MSTPLLTRIQERNGGQYGRAHIIGEVGCQASHYLIWQKCIEPNEPVLVFEDHVNIDENIFRNTLAIAEQHIE
ncbi:glycosyltransferase family 25 protein [Vibrio lentus]|nr:glycosyltransferase family 25 protein [Vibrio lentus]